MSGLKVRSDSDEDTKRWLDLPATYTKEELPADVEEVATREKIEIWDHLKKIANKVPMVSDIEIKLLIGANCAKALEPQEVIPIKDGGPFGYKSPLGWCVVGPLVKDAKKGFISCNRIVVQDVTSGKMASHHFGITNELKDVSAKQMLQRMYNQEFNESKLAFMEGIGKTDIEEISFEDREFLKMMNENSRKVGKHYELPLPLKNPAVTKIPNNSYLAETRLLSLKKRFFKDPDFFSDYKRFVEELIDKGYASQSNEEALESRTWYIPHHGVYHHSKPGKVRVVFDCTAEFKRTSLNKNLMSGPDLANQIVRVITRFCEEPVAVIGDIESTFHQVLVPEKDRSLLRFLRWENYDTSSKILDFEMNVHVFEGTSSPSCCNYALKKAALDNESNYHPVVALTLKRNFYVYDLLKSVKDVSTAVKLIQDVSKMCSDGGFCLTKFISNEL